MPRRFAMTPRLCCHHRSRGMVTILVMLFLVATVIFVLTQMLNVSSNNVIDSQRQGESHQAFFLAESGIEQATASLSGALGGTVTNSTCTGITGSFSLAGGSVSYSGASTPASCTSAPGGTPCTACTITSTGTLGISKRTVTQSISLITDNGVVCNTSGGTSCTNNPNVTWKLNLKNTTAHGAIALFDLAYPGQGNVNASCATASNCQKQIDFGSPTNGTNSVGMMVNAVSIPAGASYPIYQIFPTNKNASIAEVGVLFTGTTAPTLTGSSGIGGASYWHSSNTVGRSTDNGGTTNNGTATATGTCSGPSANNQSCTNWCHGGDTLVFSFAANVTGLNDQLSAVTFDTTGTGAQNLALSRVVKYPVSGIAGAPTDVNAEIWYASNPDYLSTATASTGGAASVTIGATFNGSLTAPSNQLSISSLAGTPSVGDTVYCVSASGCPANLTAGTATPVTIQAIAGSTLTLSSSVTTSLSNRALRAASTRMIVASVSSGFLSIDDVLVGTGITSGTKITAVAGAGNVAGDYAVDIAQTVASATVVTASGVTVRVSGVAAAPGAGTLLRVRQGTGAFLAQTKVLANPAPTATLFKVDRQPTQALSGATVCGGTCAFFSASSTTSFSITKSTGTNEWASGFTCLRGVDLTPQIVTSTSFSNRRWTEVVY